jgi:hypothetical protein
MAAIPKDLIPLSQAMEETGLKRSWFDTQVNKRRLITYRIPGQKGVFISKSALKELTQIRPNIDVQQED